MGERQRSWHYSQCT